MTAMLADLIESCSQEKPCWCSKKETIINVRRGFSSRLWVDMVTLDTLFPLALSCVSVNGKRATALHDLRQNKHYHRSVSDNCFSTYRWATREFRHLARSADFPTGLYILPSLIIFLTWAKLSHDPLDRFSPSFTKWKVFAWILLNRTSFATPQGTLLWQPIFGKICEMTFIQYAGITKRIRISPFRLTVVKGQYFFYIMCAFDSDQSTNPRDYVWSFCTFSDETAKIDIF